MTPRVRLIIVLLLALVPALASAGPAQASLEYLGRFGTPGEGAGQFGGGDGLSVSGDVYTGGNGRVEVWSPGGTFAEAFGWGVLDGKEELEHCSITCKAGIEGEEASTVDGEVLGGVTLYSIDARNNRIDEFTSSGSFQKAFGFNVYEGKNEVETCTSKCFEGTPGEAEGHFDDIEAAAVSGSTLYLVNHDRIETWVGATFDGGSGWGVGDGKEQFESCNIGCLAGKPAMGAGAITGPAGMAIDGGDLVMPDVEQHRLNVFAAGGGFIDALGWGVKDGKEEFEVCSVTCRQGLGGAGELGAGELDYPTGIAVDGGDVWVTDRDQRRINEFDLSTNTFVAAYGYGVLDGNGAQLEECTAVTDCQLGQAGPEQLLAHPLGIASDGSGVLYIFNLNSLETDEWIDRFAVKSSPSPGPGPGSPAPGSGASGSGGSGSGGSGSPHAPTPAEVIAMIARHLAPSGAGAKIGALLSHGGLLQAVSAPGAGSEMIAWYQVPHGAHLSRKARPVLVASASAHFAAAATITIKIALTHAGKALLKRSHRLVLTALAKFTPSSGGSPLLATRTFSIHR
jgi:hypothetical protein